MSCAVKNLFGTVPGLQKAEFHMRFPEKEPFGEMLVDLCETVRPQLIIADGVLAMEGDGPAGGTPRALGLVLGGEDASAVDLAVCRLMGMPAMRVPYLAAAHARGDKHQVSALECTRDFLSGFLCAAAADFRHRACAQTLGDFLTNLDFRLRAGHLQSLHVGIDGDELHAAQAGFDHAVDRVAAAAAASHDLDGSIIAGQLVILNFNHVASP